MSSQALPPASVPEARSGSVLTKVVVGLELIATPHLLATSLNLAIMQMDCRAIPSIHSARMGDPSFPRVLVLGRERRPRARVSATGQKGLLQARIVAGGLACVLACIPWCLGVVARVWDSRPYPNSCLLKFYLEVD